MLSRRERRRLLLRGALIGLLVLLAVAVVGLTIASILLGFLSVVTPAIATLLTALCVAAASGVLVLLLISSRRPHGSMLREVGALLPGLTNTVKRHPLGAVGAALALGLMTEFLQNGSKSSPRRRS